ncbi:hypothetical protein P389DRAFT_174983 [Cystobasidium minutum MCA 4210]|uniref:uncharacterized protein n=1 Tax=Cystobasidium minutum MCA 4210 TaxID=1397322 RepID=UPI0034CF22F8|eukprot:jgi/Rhomi1/174983/fgenesh1_kg.9_\
MDAVQARLQAEQERYGTHIRSKEDIDNHLEQAAERKAAIDGDKAAMAGQEVAFARAIAAENASLPHDPKTGLTREDIEHDLEEAAARKKRIDDERAAKAGAEVAHVKEVVERKKRSVQELESEKHNLSLELQAMQEKQAALETRLQNASAGDGAARAA